MDVSGAHQLDVLHSVFKTRLSPDGQPIHEETQKIELGTGKEEEKEGEEKNKEGEKKVEGESKEEKKEEKKCGRYCVLFYSRFCHYGFFLQLLWSRNGRAVLL